MSRSFPYARPGEDPRWNRLSDYFFHRHGQRVQKIPLDAGFSCPNRDGTLSFSGCVFCNPLGSGTGLGLSGLSLAEQWRKRCAAPRERGLRLFLAYLQSFSNTYGPPEKLAAVLNELRGLPGMCGLAVGTRPDCVDAHKLDRIARVCREEGWSEAWMEYGLQSANDATLQRIGRGHDLAYAERAVALAKEAGLRVCLHLVAALPGEDEEDLLRSVRWVSEQGADGVKFHCLYVCKGARLERLHAAGEYEPWSLERYVAALALVLPHLRPEIVVQRLFGDPAPGELVAPDWCGKSRQGLNALEAEMRRRDVWQGMLYGA